MICTYNIKGSNNTKPWVGVNKKVSQITFIKTTAMETTWQSISAGSAVNASLFCNIHRVLMAGPVFHMLTYTSVIKSAS